MTLLTVSQSCVFSMVSSGLHGCLFLINLFYNPATVFPPSIPPSPSSNFTSAPIPQATPSFLFRKGHVSPEYQPYMAYQVLGRLHTSPCVKVGQGDPVCGLGSQRPVKESETVGTEVSSAAWFLLDRGYQEVSFVLDAGGLHTQFSSALGSFKLRLAFSI